MFFSNYRRCSYLGNAYLKKILSQRFDLWVLFETINYFSTVIIYQLRIALDLDLLLAKSFNVSRFICGASTLISGTTAPMPQPDSLFFLFPNGFLKKFSTSLKPVLKVFPTVERMDFAPPQTSFKKLPGASMTLFSLDKSLWTLSIWSLRKEFSLFYRKKRINTGSFLLWSDFIDLNCSGWQHIIKQLLLSYG